MFDDEFFANCQVISTNANHKKITLEDIMNENNIRQVHDIYSRTGLVLNQEQRDQLQTACRAVIRNHSKTDLVKSECTALSTTFNKHSQGKKTFRNILTYEKTSYIPHNIKKYSNNIDCALNLTNSKTLCSLWKNSFMDNEMKTFCFKLHNNTLGYNYTVNKFIRNHNPYCTFCTLSREPEDGRETPYHIFFACRHTERIYEKIFRTFLGDGYGEMTRINYFGGFDSDNVCRNLSLNIVSFLFKFYIWSCKLRFRLPGEGESVDFAKSHISNFFNLNRNFRETWTKSGIDFRF